MRRASSERVDRMIEMRAAEMTLQQIADEFGLTRSRVAQLISERLGTGTSRVYGFTRRDYRRFFRAVAVVARYEHNRRHGSARRYALGCRCEDCLRANADRCLVINRRINNVKVHRRWKYPELP